MPAIAFASVCRAAKPTTRPSTADDARIPVATRLTDGNWASARPIPSTTIVAKIRRRTRRKRVSATGESGSVSWSRRPRRASVRSTSSAHRTASTTVATAVISLRCSSTNEVAVYKSAPGMAYEANFRPAAGALVALRQSEALRAGWRVFWSTRLAVFLVAFFAALSLGPPGQGGLAEQNAAKFDYPRLTSPLGGFGDLALSPLARWDSVWYLRVADDGYPDGGPEAAFFPLYPMLARGIGELGGGSRGAVLIGAYLVSLAAFLGALGLLYKLVSLELGRRLGKPTLLLVPLFPPAPS